MKPTVIVPSRPGVATLTAAPAVPMVQMNTGAVILRPEQQPKAEAALSLLDFEAMQPGEIIQIGLEAEQALQRTLDGFLSRLDKKSAARVFALFDRLEKGVDDAKLPEILSRIENGEKPGLFGSLFGKLRGKDVQDVVSELMEEVGELVSGRTRTLADELSKLETELSGEMNRLFIELQQLDVLKKSYAEHFSDFTVAAAVSRGLLENARGLVAAREAAANPADVVEQGKLSELRDKLRLLESRALALEGTYTRLPADQMVIQQIEQAGIATLQETATTVASRFASIKMTLLSIHGAFAVKSVQQIAGRQEKLDRQLTELRGRALKDVSVAAAKAPGDNRLAQAQQIEQIIATTKEINGLVATARKSTEDKFDQARQKLAVARQELAELASR